MQRLQLGGPERNERKNRGKKKKEKSIEIIS